MYCTVQVVEHTGKTTSVQPADSTGLKLGLLSSWCVRRHQPSTSCSICCRHTFQTQHPIPSSWGNTHTQLTNGWLGQYGMHAGVHTMARQQQQRQQQINQQNQQRQQPQPQPQQPQPQPQQPQPQPPQQPQPQPQPPSKYV